MLSSAADDTVLVLIADDEGAIAEVVADIVQDLGYKALVAEHGGDALKLARNSWPALVITDLMMPELNGAALIAELRAEQAAKGRAYVPVILMTAAGSERARGAGADAVLNKPFNLDELEHLIAQFLSGAKRGA
jgi:DNA-binding response OmpR family regulator